MLIFPAGLAMGDVQCAEFFIPDDSYPQGLRSFNVSIGDDAGTVSDGDGGGDGGRIEDGGGSREGGGGAGGGVRINSDLSPVTVDIEIDIDDSKLLHYCTLVIRCAKLVVFACVWGREGVSIAYSYVPLAILCSNIIVEVSM